jgi:hypothetical protein
MLAYIEGGLWNGPVTEQEATPVEENTGVGESPKSIQFFFLSFWVWPIYCYRVMLFIIPFLGSEESELESVLDT